MALNKDFMRNILLSTVLLVSLIVINKFTTYKMPSVPVKYSTFNSTFSKIFLFGNYRFYSSYLWTTTLLNADINHVKNHETSWLYYRFNLIADLDPTFYENYRHGGVYLSIIKDDIYGARDIFERGLKIFPNDFDLLYYNAFNYHFEIRDYEESYLALKKLKAAPGSSRVKILDKIIKQAIEKRSDNLLEVEFLQKELENTEDELIKDVLKKKIEKIKKGSPEGSP